MSDMVKCPFCGEIMHYGNICARGGGGMYWLPEYEKIKLYETISKKTIEKHEGVALSVNETGTIQYPAHICKTCKKVILDF